VIESDVIKRQKSDAQCDVFSPYKSFVLFLESHGFAKKNACNLQQQDSSGLTLSLLTKPEHQKPPSLRGESAPRRIRLLKPPTATQFEMPAAEWRLTDDSIGTALAMHLHRSVLFTLLQSFTPRKK
jgi:hypothetical protein